MAFLQSIPSFEVKLLFIFNRAKFSLILWLPNTTIKLSAAKAAWD
jgi:hypothetical protein